MYDEIDEIADLADRCRGMSEFEFAIVWASLTAAEQDEFMVLMGERAAHGREVLEGIQENVRILRLLFAYREGAITALESSSGSAALCPIRWRCRSRRGILRGDVAGERRAVQGEHGAVQPR